MEFDIGLGCRFRQNLNRTSLVLLTFGCLHTKRLGTTVRTLMICAYLRQYSHCEYHFIKTSVCTTFKMGVAKKEKSRKERQGKTGDSMSNVKTKGENFYRYSFKLALL